MVKRPQTRRFRATQRRTPLVSASGIWKIPFPDNRKQIERFPFAGSVRHHDRVRILSCRIHDVEPTQYNASPIPQKRQYALVLQYHQEGSLRYRGLSLPENKIMGSDDVSALSLFFVQIIFQYFTPFNHRNSLAQNEKASAEYCLQECFVVY